MKFLITGGTGFIGTKLVASLIKNNHSITMLTRDKKKINNSKIFLIEDLEVLNTHESFDVIINLAGASISKRWAKQYKKELVNSRVSTTRNLITLIEKLKNKPSLLINASAIGYYGVHKEGNVIDEQSKPTKDFTHSLCDKWEYEAMKAENYGVRVCIARLGVVLGKNGGALEKMLLPFKLGLGSIIGNGRQIMSWIDIDDVINIFNLFINDINQRGAYNLTSPNPVSNDEFSKKLGKHLNRKVIFSLPSLAVKLLFGEMGEKLLLKGNSVMPKRILDTGYVFHYPYIDEALFNILNKN
jgi:uncharacterized protein (TIGR01777 family)